MNKILGIVLAVAVSVMGLTGTAFAGSYYATLQGTNTEFDASGTDIGDGVGGGIGFGANYNRWLAAEVTADYLGSDTFGSVSFAGRSLGAWIVVDPTIATISSMPLKVTARVGVTRTKLSTTVGNFYDTDPAYGAGIALGVSKHVDVTLDYRHRSMDILGGDVDFHTVGLGAKYTF